MWVHVLPDQLTGKSSCELRVELALVKEMVGHAEALQQELGGLYSHALSHLGHGWEGNMERLAALDFQLLHDPPATQGADTAFRYIQSQMCYSFHSNLLCREKLEKLVTF